MMHLLSIKCFIIIIICVRFFFVYMFVHENNDSFIILFITLTIRMVYISSRILKSGSYWNCSSMDWNYCQFWWKILSRCNVRALISNTSPIRLSQYFLLKMLKIKNKASQTYLFLLTLKICIILHPIAQ